MSRKINVRSPFYLFAQPAFTTTTTTSATTSTTTSGSLLTYSCSIANLTGGSIASTGAITNPSVTDGTIIGISETNGGTTISNYSANSGAERSVTLWFQIVPNSSYTNTTFWCSISMTQLSGTTTTQNPSSLPVLSCSTANLTGGSVSQNGSIVNPSVTGGSIILKSLSNGGSSITSINANTGNTVQSVTLWFKIQPDSNYNQTPVWCSKPYTQGTTTTASTTTQAAATTSGNMIAITGAYSSTTNVCSQVTSNTYYLIQGVALADSAVVYTNNTGNTAFNGGGSVFGISSTGGSTPTHTANISSTGVISNLAVCTGTTTTTTQARSVFYRSAGKTSTNQFCGYNYSLNTLIYTDSPGSASTQLNANCYTTATGSQSFNGYGKKYIINHSPMVYQGVLTFEWWEITNGVVTDVGTYSGCAGSYNPDDGNNIY